VHLVVSSSYAQDPHIQKLAESGLATCGQSICQNSLNCIVAKETEIEVLEMASMNTWIIEVGKGKPFRTENILKVEDINFDNLSYLINILGKSIKKESMALLERQGKRNLQSLEKKILSYIRKIKSEVSEKNFSEVNSFFSFYEDLLKKSWEVTRAQGIEEQIALVQKIIPLKVKVMNFEQSVLLDGVISNLPVINKEHFLVCDKKIEDLSIKESISFFHLWDGLMKLSFMERRSSKSLEDEELWDDIWGNFPLPLALINSSENLLLHSHLFSKMSIVPRECLKLSNGQTFEFLEVVYQVFRTSLGSNEGDLFIFFTHEKETEDFEKKSVDYNLSSQELGIVSSSIAHELNNPVSGVLAALALVKLEENWSGEDVQILEEMECSARRCSDLIDIFLGFSKAQISDGGNVKIEETLQNAFSLLRFRMVESNQFLRYQIETTGDLNGLEADSSILTMIFYIILNEVITVNAHLGLLRAGNQKGVFIEVILSENGCKLLFPENLIENIKIENIKLLMHLFKLEKITWSVENDCLNLISN